jgi:hypothetical protein
MSSKHMRNSNGHFNGRFNGGSNGASKNGSSNPDAPEPLADWTVMVYLGGDNNLSAECVWSLTEMQRGMCSDKVKLIAQYDPNDGLARTRRYKITAEGVQMNAAKTRRDAKDGKEQPPPANPAPEEEPRELNELVTDLATWNPRTGEAHFGRESHAANLLANRRLKEETVRLARQERLRKSGQALNGHLRPDDFGASIMDTDAASPITLYNFLSYCIQKYPARHYMVVLSGHSAGIEPSYLLRDDSSRSAMDFRQLKAVFEQLKQHDFVNGVKDGRANNIDILGFDTCLMSMAEISCDLKGLVGIMIGSETYTPSSGWPYQTILRRLCKSSSPDNGTRPAPMPRRKLAAAIVEEYVGFYRDYVTSGVSVALSALDVTKVEKLAPVVRKLSDLLIKGLKAEHPELNGKPAKKRRPLTDALLLAHWEAQSYNGEWYVDLVDFCECLKSRYPNKAVRAACQNVIDFLKDQFVIKSDYCGPTYQYSYGVAIYFPWCSVASYLWAFGFAARSHWGNFLAFYTNLTRRTFRMPDNVDELPPEDVKRIEAMKEFGGNFLNYATNLTRRVSGKRASDKMISKELDILLFNRMGSDKMGSDKMGSDKMGSDKMGSDKMGSDKMGSDKMGSDKMGSDKMGSDKMGSDKMGSDKSGNPIHSMRNPPIVSHDSEF